MTDGASGDDSTVSAFAGHPLFAHIPADAYGSSEAVQAVGGVAAPLLAGFGLTSAVLVIQSPGALRWPGFTLGLLAAAVVALIMTVQYSFWARHFYAHYSDALAWWPDKDQSYRTKQVGEDLARHLEAYGVWANRTRRGYAVGLLLLLTAFGTLIWPRANAHGYSWRVGAVLIVAAAVVYELLWILVASSDRRPRETTGVRHALARVAWVIAPGDPFHAPRKPAIGVEPAKEGSGDGNH